MCAALAKQCWGFVAKADNSVAYLRLKTEATHIRGGTVSNRPRRPRPPYPTNSTHSIVFLLQSLLR